MAHACAPRKSARTRACSVGTLPGALPQGAEASSETRHGTQKCDAGNVVANAACLRPRRCPKGRKQNQSAPPARRRTSHTLSAARPLRRGRWNIAGPIGPVRVSRISARAAGGRLRGRSGRGGRAEEHHARIAARGFEDGSQVEADPRRRFRDSLYASTVTLIGFYFAVGKAEMRNRAQPIGISVTCSTGSPVFTGLRGTSCTIPLASSFQDGSRRAFTTSSMGAS